jgi:hypothetical protein
MFNAKYIRWGRDNMYIFPPAGNIHCEIAVRLCDIPPISAGFIKILSDGTIQCYGESISLGLKAEPEDSEIAKRILKGDEI